MGQLQGLRKPSAVTRNTLINPRPPEVNLPSDPGEDSVLTRAASRGRIVGPVRSLHVHATTGHDCPGTTVRRMKPDDIPDTQEVWTSLGLNRDGLSFAD
jgi:hypothetical protein